MPRRSPRLSSDPPPKSAPQLCTNSSSHSTYCDVSKDCPGKACSASTPVYDVYLGGATVESHSWRTDVAIPMLERHGLTYCSSGIASSPFSNENGDFSRTASPDDLAHREPGNSLDPAPNGSENVRDSCINSTNPDDRQILEKKSLHKYSISRKEQARSYNSHSSNLHDSPGGLSSSSVNGVTVDVLGNERQGRLLPREAARIDQCRVLLFVITSNTRCVSPMTLAAHYIGLGWRVVLCVQNIPDDAIVDGDRLTKAATKDYNRGRSYLTDQARKDGVPVFTDIAEAVECVVQQTRTAR